MKKIFLAIFVAVMMVGTVCSANALSINLSTERVAFGEETGVPDIEAFILPIMGTSEELYKATPGQSDEGPLALNYETGFIDNNEASLIAHISFTDVIKPVAYLLAKDGSAKDNNPDTHAWYLFNLTALGWNGSDIVTINGLWPDQGSFSHISLYSSGDPNIPIPEPYTLLLLGLGLVGIAGIRRKMK